MSQDAVRFLGSQHDEARELFRTVAAERGDARRRAFEPLVRLLAVHETAEEMIVYPSIRSAGADGKRIADARTQEEDRAKKMLSDLEKLELDSAEFETQFASFREAVEIHAEREEAEVFPLLEKTTDEQQLERMTAALEVAEGIAPTHPHKLAPESALGNAMVGPFVGMVDRVRDAIRGATN
jgi:hemerythrin superfamily protein